MNIERIHVWDCAAKFKQGVYTNSRCQKSTTRSRVFQIFGTGGWKGFGEVVFPFLLPRQLEEQVIQAEEIFLSELVGKNIDHLMDMAEAFRAREAHWSSVAFALETAWYDLQGKQQNTTISSILHGKRSHRVTPYLSISVSDQRELQERLRSETEDAKVIQLKLTNRSWVDDMRWIHQILDHHPSVELLLADANGKWSVSQACEIISRCQDPRIIWEEPCETYSENAEVEQITHQRIMADQCVGSMANAEQAVREKAVSAITIKPAYLGGLSTARYLLNRCVECGVRVRVDGPWCGGIGAAAVLHLAAGVEPELLIASCNLQAPLEASAMPGGVVEFPDGKISPPEGPGLGLKNESLDERFGVPQAIYSA